MRDEPPAMLLDELVNGLTDAGTGDEPIIVDDHDSAGRHPLVRELEQEPRRRVQVDVGMDEVELALRRRRHVLYPPLEDLYRRNRRKVLADVFQLDAVERSRRLGALLGAVDVLARMPREGVDGKDLCALAESAPRHEADEAGATTSEDARFEDADGAIREPRRTLWIAW